MTTGPVLRLSAQQAEQLAALCSVYRSYLWQQVMPTPERNQAVRRVQAMQGRLLSRTSLPQTQTQAETVFSLNVEEGNTLKKLLGVLTQQYEREAVSGERDQKLFALAMFRLLLERASRHYLQSNG